MKHLLTTILLLLPAISMWAQHDETEDEYMDDFVSVEAIVSRWTDLPLRVYDTYRKAPIRNFAQAFCKQFPDYAPNRNMADYLKKPGKYTWEDKGYYCGEDVRNGYIKADAGGQGDYKTEICYWKRKNGHALVGVLMLKSYEGEQARYALLFYDYDPKTRMMTPDLTVWQQVNGFLQGLRGSCFIDMPLQGKDISVCAVYWDPEEDFIYTDYKLRWDGNGFKGAVSKARGKGQ